MKLVADDGTEYEIRSANAGYELLRKLVPPVPKSGHRPWCGYVEKYRDGFRARRVDQGAEVLGPKRATREEARADHDRMMVRTPLAPPTLGQGSEVHRARMRAAAFARHEMLRAASTDGKEHLAPPKCHACQEVGHKSNRCPKNGWVKKVYAPRGAVKRVKRCGFCQGVGHYATTCPNRRAAIVARLRQRAA